MMRDPIQLNRRGFLAVAAATATGAWAADATHKHRSAQRSGAPEPLTIEDNGKRFLAVHEWGLLPEDWHYGLTHGVAVDRDGFVHVLHAGRKDSASRDCLVTFDPEGQFVRSWGSQFFGGAHGLDVFAEPDGTQAFYITDLNQGLFKTTPTGEVIWHVRRPSFYDDKKLKYRPSNVGVTAEGDVYLADGYGSYHVHRIDRNGKYRGTFAGAGRRTAGKLTHPHGLFVDRRGAEPRVVVGENYSLGRQGDEPGSVQVFDLEGPHLGYWNVDVRAPRHFDERAGLVVVPDLNARVTLIGSDNRVVAQLGDGWTNKPEVRALRNRGRAHYKPGRFVCPHDAAFAPDGSVFVAEWVRDGRITRLIPI